MDWRWSSWKCALNPSVGSQALPAKHFREMHSNKRLPSAVIDPPYRNIWRDMKRYEDIVETEATPISSQSGFVNQLERWWCTRFLQFCHSLSCGSSGSWWMLMVCCRSRILEDVPYQTLSYIIYIHVYIIIIYIYIYFIFMAYKSCWAIRSFQIQQKLRGPCEAAASDTIKPSQGS